MLQRAQTLTSNSENILTNNTMHNKELTLLVSITNGIVEIEKYHFKLLAFCNCYFGGGRGVCALGGKHTVEGLNCKTKYSLFAQL